MASPTKIPLELQRQRQERHNKLMKMIHQYSLSRQQKFKLEKIKSHTMMDINLRYLRSQVNRNYKFPFFIQSSQTLNTQQQQSYFIPEYNEEEDRILKIELKETQDTKSKLKKKGDYFLYDLRSQNQSKSERQSNSKKSTKMLTTKILSLEQSRRVHSLGNERSQQKNRNDILVRRHNPIKYSNQRFSKSPTGLIPTKSSKSLKTIKIGSQIRKSSKQNLILQQSLQNSISNNTNSSKNLQRSSQKVKLPEIKLSSSQSRSLKKLNVVQHEKLKTEKIYQEEDIQYAIGKKLVTQADSGQKVLKGVEKYLKQIEAEKLQLYSNNQSSKIMKKEKDHQRKKANINLFQTAKNSLKRQIQ